MKRRRDNGNNCFICSKKIHVSVFWEGRHCQSEMEMVKIVIGQTRCTCPTFGYCDHSLVTNVVFKADLFIPVSFRDNTQSCCVKAGCGIKVLV